jgi:hypothetical protein
VSRAPRIPSESFAGGAFATTAAVLVAAPFVAAFDLAGSYLPFSLLRLWMVGFAAYGWWLSGRAAGWRRIWRIFFLPLSLIFVFVRGLEVEEWAIIDFAAAALVGISVLSLRTEPARAELTTPSSE